jgi:hypothetical protein
MNNCKPRRDKPEQVMDGLMVIGLFVVTMSTVAMCIHSIT